MKSARRAQVSLAIGQATLQYVRQSYRRCRNDFPAGKPMPQSSTLETYRIQRGFTARFALWAAVGAGLGGVAPSASAVVYNRTAAVNYANNYWNKCVTDGYFWINGSTANYYGDGQPVPVNVAG